MSSLHISTGITTACACSNETQTEALLGWSRDLLLQRGILTLQLLLTSFLRKNQMQELEKALGKHKDLMVESCTISYLHFSYGSEDPTQHRPADPKL